MTGGIVSDGRSADDTLTVFDEPVYDPGTFNDNPKDISEVWITSDNLRKLLRDQDDSDKEGRSKLTSALIYQLSTISLYWQMGLFIKRLEDRSAPSKDVSLYILLFPGEARDNTGIKDLNDKVIGQSWNSEFIRRRMQAIHDIFHTAESKFMIAAQTYKTAYILTYEKTRNDFALKLAELDEALRIILLQILKAAEEDANSKQKKEIRRLRRKLSKKGYRFDIFFGLRVLKPESKSRLETVYLLVTEALKGAAIARYVAKVNSLKTKTAKNFATRIAYDSRKLDARGKEYDWPIYMRASDMAEKTKALFVRGYTKDSPYALNDIYVDTVWTEAFVNRMNLYWGNPDVVRDVRKKKLEAAPVRKGNLTYSFPIQKELLELWLVTLNMLDFIKQFKSSEFHNEVQRYHDDVLDVFLRVGTPSSDINWDKLEKVLTHDVRQSKKIAVLGTASEFQFYSYAADHAQRIFFTMDIRDLGVELMLLYEHSNREIGHRKFQDTDLMEETFRATDPIDERRRVTYDRVVEVFRKHYDKLSHDPGVALRAAQQAFGGQRIDKLGTFEEAVQIMLGGDEVYIAAHPLFADHAASIIAELDATPYDKDGTLNMRASIAFSGATGTKGQQPREDVQRSHQQAMRLADVATSQLKSLERTQRRIERLIDMLEANDRKKGKAPNYRKELERLALTKLFGRAKRGHPNPLAPYHFKVLLDALERGDFDAAEEKEKFELVDFSGNVVKHKKLEKDAQVLESRVRRDVGSDNTRVHPPPATKMPKWIEELLKRWADPKRPNPTP